jgi:hypothetical protein
MNTLKSIRYNGLGQGTVQLLMVNILVRIMGMID